MCGVGSTLKGALVLFSVPVNVNEVELGRKVMALRKRPILASPFGTVRRPYESGVGLVDYRQLQIGDRSVLPAISPTKTLSFLEYGYCTVGLSKIGNHADGCGILPLLSDSG
jgi:hypothetical protein